MVPPMGGGNKSLFAGLGHMTKMATMPIYGKKPFKNLHLQNQRANDLVAWYVASGPRPFIVCSNEDPRLTLTYVMPRSNLVSYAFI